MPRSVRASGGASGFTLIETLVVLAVLGLMVTVLLSRGLTRSASIDLRAAARTLTDTLRHARGQAIASDRPVRVSVADMRGVLDGTARRNRAGAISLAVHSPPDDPHDDAVLRFAPDGSANDARIVLDEAHERISIRVDWLTGRITPGTIQRVHES